MATLENKADEQPIKPVQQNGGTCKAEELQLEDAPDNHNEVGAVPLGPERSCEPIAMSLSKPVSTYSRGLFAFCGLCSVQGISNRATLVRTSSIRGRIFPKVKYVASC